ncbi:tellurite-resistance/dicarboxylate transporter [Desulfolucanica intricata]|uniref:tellurite-resistance/dicarboxylate transporter n=1 Tax=Desulfolucanica intricata TaxID=1285191 RepID=UPI0008353F5A|nr:tellurite-resistance/dicarboxylate transporter [Desulfolucanica intricata]
MPVIKNFAPSWFASVMGTGIVALTSYFYGTNFSLLQGLGNTILFLNIFLFFFLLIPWILRFIFYREQALLDLKEPVIGQFYATMPIACLVVAADLLVIGIHNMNISLAIIMAKGFWVSGAVIALIFSIIIPLQNFINKKVLIESINPAWFMPPVSLIVIPIPGAKLISYWPNDWQQAMLIFNYVSWGSGFFLFLFLEAICLYRLICGSPLPGKLAPTVWINLGPIGAGTIALLNLGSASAPVLGVHVVPVLNLLALFLWGFGFWWFICALCLTVYYINRNNMPFTLSWWAFTFPLGAYSGATYLISSYLKSPAVNNYGFLCYLLLLVFWSIVLIRTIVGVIRKEFFPNLRCEKHNTNLPG